MKNIDKVLEEITNPNKHFTGETDAPTHLYHYTNADALKKIISNKSFWLFDIRYMNDSSEFTHIFEIAKELAREEWSEARAYAYEFPYEVISTDVYDWSQNQEGEDRRMIEKRGIDAVYGKIEEKELTPEEKELKIKYARYVAEQLQYEQKSAFYGSIAVAIEDFIRRGSSINPSCYVASFSLNRDQLSQWRGYCSRGGYSLGIDAIKLSESIRPNFVLGECVYCKDKKRSYLSNVFEDFRTSFNTLVAEGILVDHRNPERYSAYEGSGHTTDAMRRGQELNKQFKKWQEEIVATLARLAPFFKHEAFKEEAEWRSVNTSAIFPEEANEPEKSFFPSVTTLRPYAIMELESESFAGVQVTVGPMENQELAKDSMYDFLQEERGDTALNFKTVLISDIPYRTS